MNEQEFILLMEEYFDGTLSPEGRVALRDEVAANPERRTLFETQSRQNVRIHAQTSRVDFTESQRIAVMVMEIAAKPHPANGEVKMYRDPTFREHLQAIRAGLHAPKDSDTNRNARFALWRLFGPAALGLAVNAIAILLLIFVWVPSVTPPPEEPVEGTEIISDTLVTTPTLDPTAAPPAQPPRGSDPAGSAATPPGQVVPTESHPDAGPETAAMLPDARPPIESFTGSTPSSKLPRSFTMPIASPSWGARNKAARDRLLRGGDGSSGNPLTERAVTNALGWLRDHQLENGSWAGQDPVAMTGLALLTYLAHGEGTGVESAYGDTVTAGLKYLLAKQDAQGAFSKNVYAHAIATYAVSEAFTLTRIMGLRDAMEKAVQLIIDGQQTGGGYDYNYAKGTRFDTSVSGWQIQALKAARIAGAENAGLEAALERSARFLQTQAFVHDGSGFVYDGTAGAPPTGGAKWTMTGVGTLCLQLLGKSTAPQVRLGLKALQDVPFEWSRDAKPKLYGEYYVTQAKFQQDNKVVWQKWNTQMQKVVLKNQFPDGHWENGDYDQGSHVYTTTLCTLMLEVYYRYLPTFEKAPEKILQAKAPTGEITVNVH